MTMACLQARKPRSVSPGISAHRAQRDPTLAWSNIRDIALQDARLSRSGRKTVVRE
jgi:hypothetical protein